MLAKLDELLQKDVTGRFQRSWFQRRETVMQFLSRRCSKDLLSFYLQRKPALLEEVSEPGLYLDAVSEVDLAARLHELGLLPVRRRKDFARAVCEYAVAGEDLYALWSDQIRTLLTNSEFEDLEARIRSELLPRLDGVRHRWESEYDGTETAEDHMAKYVEDLDMLKNHFAEDPSAVKAIKYQEAAVDEWIFEYASGDSTAERPWSSQSTDVPTFGAGERSIFDDIDTECTRG